jgi:signal transduction histidine kinase
MLISFVIVGIGALSLISEKHLLHSEMTKHYSEITLRLARVCEESLMQNDLVLFNYLKGLTNERGFKAATFIDRQGTVQVHSDPQFIGNTLTLPTPEEPPKTPVFKSLTQQDGREVWIYSAPVAFGNTVAGFAHLILDKKAIDTFVKESLTANLKKWIPISLAAFVLGFLGSLILARTLMTPINEIVKRMKAVGEGCKEPFTELCRKDELGWMASELNNTILKLKELDQLKNEFVSAVTHELRSPLTAIGEFVSLLLNGVCGPVPSQQQDMLMTIKNNSIRLAQFVDDVLTTSKLESRRLDVYLDELDIGEILEDVRKLYAPVASEKKLKLLQEELKTAEEGFKIANSRYNSFQGNLIDLRETIINLYRVKAEIIEAKINLNLYQNVRSLVNGIL